MTAVGARTLAQHRLVRARAALDEATLLFDERRYSGALNRAYYAAFYAARALLALKGLDSSRHSGVIALFQEHFVRSGTIPVDVARALPRAFEKRQSSDYGDYVEPSEAEVQKIRDEVLDLIQACEAVVAAS